MIAARRAFERAPLRVADSFARAIRRAPDTRLEQLMRTPARRVVLEGIFWQMPQHLVAKQAVGVNAVVRWRITGRPDGGADTYQLQIADGRCRVSRGTDGPEPRVMITLGGTELLQLAIGDLDPMQAYFSGRIGLAGDIMLAARLGSLFHVRATGRPPSR